MVNAPTLVFDYCVAYLVGNIAPDGTEAELREIFSRVGNIVSFRSEGNGNHAHNFGHS